MKKYLQITLVTTAFLTLIVAKSVFKGDDEEGQVQAPTLPGNNTAVPTNPQKSSVNSSISTIPPAVSGGKFKDGKYAGSVEDAFYGNIQVQAVIANGKLADVVFLQYPNDNRTSVMVNTQASVYLKEEALAAQSADVNIVTGASDSSAAFRKSLSTALRQAQI